LPNIFGTQWRADALAGQPAAIDRLADHALQPLYRFCLYRVGGDHHLCEEVVQETMLGAVANLARYDPSRSDGRIFPWLTGLARNEIRKVLTRRRQGANLQQFWQKMDEQLLSLYAMLESEPFSDELLARGETQQIVNATVAQLPPHYAQALEAKYVQEHTVREIASAMDLTAKAVESLLGRARAAFRATFLSMTENLPAEPAD